MARAKIITISIGARHKDIEAILERKKNEGVSLSNYICEAIRTYEYSPKPILEDLLKELIKNEIENHLKGYSPPDDKLVEVVPEVPEQEEAISDEDMELFSDIMAEMGITM